MEQLFRTEFIVYGNWAGLPVASNRNTKELASAKILNLFISVDLKGTIRPKPNNWKNVWSGQNPAEVVDVK